MRHTPRITSDLSRLFWHGEAPSRKLSCAENGPVLDEIHRILVHRQIFKPMSQITLCTTRVSQIPYLQHRRTLTTLTPDRLDSVTAGLAWCTAMIEAVMYPKRPRVLGEIRRILVHQQHNQTGVVNKPKADLTYDTGVANTLFTTPRHLHGTHAGSTRHYHGWYGMA